MGIVPDSFIWSAARRGRSRVARAHRWRAHPRQLLGTIKVGVAFIAFGTSVVLAVSPSTAGAVDVNGCQIVANPTDTNYTNCPGANLAGADLSHMDLTHAFLENADLTGAAVTRTTFLGANLEMALLSKVSGDHTDFGGAKLRGANFTGAGLSSPDFGATNMPYTDFTGAQISDGDFFGADMFRAVLPKEILGHGNRFSAAFCPDGKQATDSSTCGLEVKTYWSYIKGIWFQANFPTGKCTERFGVVGTQVCNGSFTSQPWPDPIIAGWRFNDGGDGTVKSTASTSGRMIIGLFFPSSEMYGTLPNERSNRLTVTYADTSGHHYSFRSPPDNGTAAPGSQGGPLDLNVDGGCRPAGCSYDFKIRGWVLANS